MKNYYIKNFFEDVQCGRDGTFTEDDKYKINILLKDITEEEKENIENIIMQDIDNNYFETDIDQYNRKYLYLNITENMLLKLLDFFK